MVLVQVQWKENLVLRLEERVRHSLPQFVAFNPAVIIAILAAVLGSQNYSSQLPASPPAGRHTIS